jgi:hypothetical protein
MTLARGPRLGPEHDRWFWHPNRAGVRGPEPWFERQLAGVDPALRVTWSPIHQEWLMWAPSPRIARTGGWNLLFTISPDALDERQFARLYSCSVQRWGSAKRYFDHVEAQLQRDQDRYERCSRAAVMDQAMESFDHSQIKVGYGSSNGSKFAEYHS